MKSRIEIEVASKARQEWADLAGREDSSAVRAEDARFKIRQGFIIDSAVDAGFGVTRKCTGGQAGGEDSGRPENPPLAELQDE